MNNILLQFGLNEQQNEQFEQYYQLLISENEKYNLTAITDKREVYIKHFEDSLLVASEITKKDATLIDIGAGAGFPSIPLKILLPDLQVIIIEPIKKRCLFLEKLITLLGLTSVKIINGRAEDVITDYREKADIIVARAVASLNILLEITIPFLKVNGSFIAMKGSNADLELKNAEAAMKELRIDLEQTINKELSEGYGKRVLLAFKKKAITSSKYPRNFSQIKKKPL